MLNNGMLFLILLLAHLLGDYYFQPQKLADKKEKYYSAVLIHSLIYAAFVGLTALVVDARWWVFVVAALAHWLIDSLKFLLRKKKFSKATLFIIDQALHLLTLLLLAWFSPAAVLRPWSISLGERFWAWLVLILLVAKPVNISMDILFSKFSEAAKEEQKKQLEKTEEHRTQTIGSLEKPESSKDEKIATQEVEGAGALIGLFERLFVVIFVALGQYSAMSLLIAAKSLARFDRITKNQAFAEYYLIGTLFSILFALVSYLLIFKLIIPA